MSKVTKWTPGPWVVGKDLVGPVSREDDQSYGMITPVAYIDRYDFPDSHEANARIIAAAPELYEALDRLVAYVECGGATSGDIENALDALAKARGES